MFGGELRVWLTCVVACLAMSMSVASQASTPRFDADDFLVADFNGTLDIYDYDWTYKGQLDAEGSSDYTVLRDSKLAIDHQGNVVIAGDNPFSFVEVQVYDPMGRQIPQRGTRNSDALLELFRRGADYPLDIAVLANGNYVLTYKGRLDNIAVEIVVGGGLGDEIQSQSYVTVDAEGGLLLRQPGWYPVERISKAIYDPVRGFDHDSPEDWKSVLSGVGSDIGRISYRLSTDTFLVSAYISGAYEGRSLSGTYFVELDKDLEVLLISEPSGSSLDYLRELSSGPNGDIFAINTDIYRYTVPVLSHWSKDGAYLGEIDLSAHTQRPTDIIWVGNFIPEPGTLALVGLGAVALWRAVLR